MPSVPNILLLGPRASGKTTVGQLLALRLARPFVDLDPLTARVLNARTAGEALIRHGEPRFREAEAQALADALRSGGQVIALGGGTPLAPGVADALNRARAGHAAVTIYLRADPATLQGRLAADPTLRPALTSAGTLDEVETILSQREPVYRNLADIVIDAGDSVGRVVDRIAAELAARP